jgi:hypothetical protein
VTRQDLKRGATVRLRGEKARGMVFSTPYKFDGKTKVAVVWDAHPKWVLSVDVSELVLVEEGDPDVPIEAQPYSVGALR